MGKKNAMDNNIRKSSLVHHPFRCLKGSPALQDRPSSPPIHPSSHREKEQKTDPPPPEEQLFLQAMKGVTPIARDHAADPNMEAKFLERRESFPGDEAMSQLARLVDCGEGFVVSDTPEYMEGTGYNVQPEFARRLHRGDFSIQAHIDLHGFHVAAAKEAVESFLRASIRRGKRTVLIIHGRGHSSPGEPVLKNKLREWLGQSYWLKRVIAYTSAQSYDGGAGATYILLRSRPVAKKPLKNKSATRA